jgi:hypothetical protein
MLSDISMDDFTKKITKTYYNPRNVTKEYQLLTPKTSKSIRTIELDPYVFEVLAQHKHDQNEIKKLNKDTYYDMTLYLQRQNIIRVTLNS